MNKSPPEFTEKYGWCEGMCLYDVIEVTGEMFGRFEKSEYSAKINIGLGRLRGPLKYFYIGTERLET